MKPKLLVLLPLSWAAASAVLSAKEKPPEPPVPVVSGPPAVPREAPSAGRTYEQKVYGPGATLVSLEKAQQVVDTFRAAYERLGSPRMLFVVNRELVDENSGLQLKSRTEQVVTERTEARREFTPDPNAPRDPAAPAPQTQVNVAIGGGDAGSGANGFAAGKGSGAASTEKVTAENRYESGKRENLSLSDRQTVREVERLFGRPFRQSGAKLADQRVASQLIADQPLSHFTAPANDTARKDREALAKVADVVVEVLVSSRTAVAPGVSGDQEAAIPDIQVTAIRLSDSAIVGQASSSDILGRDRDAVRIARSYDVKDITEATALALMEDIASTVR